MGWSDTGFLITALLGTGLFSFFLPRLIDHASGDLNSRIDGRTDQKFKDNHFIELQNSVNQMAGQLKTLSDNVNILLVKSIKQAASLSIPDLKRQLPQINQVLIAAKREGVPPGSGVIKDLHDKLRPLLDQQATLSLASYHSVFNQNPFATFAVTLTSAEGDSQYSAPTPLGETPPKLSVPKGAATKETGARFEPIGKDLNPQNKGANPYLTLRGGGVVLDGERVRNVVFIGVHVVYNGGPLILDNATFIDCQFSFQQTRHGEELALRSIISEAVTFTAD